MIKIDVKIFNNYIETEEKDLQDTEEITIYNKIDQPSSNGLKLFGVHLHYMKNNEKLL